MNKSILSFILFLSGIFAYGQNDYGVLIKTTLNELIPGYTTMYTIEGRNNNNLPRFSTGNIQPLNQVSVKYNFYYTNDVTKLYYLTFQMNSFNEVRCAHEYTVNYDKTTTLDQDFSSCFGYSILYTLHLIQPNDNSVCLEENISLNDGWNWEYQFDTDGWKAFPSQFQEKRSISFNLKDLDGYNAKSKIYFRTGYQTQFTNTIVYNIIGCSPEPDGKPIAEKTKCKFQSSGSVTLKFKTELKDGDKFLFNLFRASPEGLINSVFASKNEIINNTFTLTGLAEGSYFIKYQSQTTTDNNTQVGSSAITTDFFDVGSPDPLTFSIAQLQPNCNGDQGAIQVTAKGGTNPYYYMIDNETLAQKHLLTTDPINLTEGDHNIKVIDSNECTEK